VSEPAPFFRRPFWLGIAFTCVLTIWNGLLGLYGSPFFMGHRYDGTQYHLLVRNRLHGHYEIGDSAHTVRDEGRHPMWRPGIVWIEEGLVPLAGSVRTAAIAASVVGTVLLELALLALAHVTFGGATALAVLGLLLWLRLSISSCFAVMALSQGPEPWAAAAVMAGLALLTIALRDKNVLCAVAAGIAAGLSEVFRSGNLFLFAAACAVFGLRDLMRRDWRRLLVTGAALALFLGTSAVAGRLAPSDVNKNVANLWGIVVEQTGPKLPDPRSGEPVIFVGGLQVTPSGDETVYDSIVRNARGDQARDFLREHAGLIASIYRLHLEEVFAKGASGFRNVLGMPIVVLLFLQIVLSVLWWNESSWATLAFTGAILAHYLGPLTLFRGDVASHYLFLVLGLALVLAARGPVRLIEILDRVIARWRPEPEAPPRFHLRWLLPFAPVAVLAGFAYVDVLSYVRKQYDQAQQEQSALDALQLAGQRVACRNMSWFVDRNVRTVLLPYAGVAELERYAQAQNLDGILFWDHEEFPFFRIMPEDDAALDRQLRASAVFGAPQQSGAWRYYPVRRP
jgi:hypothetical protein